MRGDRKSAVPEASPQGPAGEVDTSRHGRQRGDVRGKLDHSAKNPARFLIELHAPPEEEVEDLSRENFRRSSKEVGKLL